MKYYKSAQLNYIYTGDCIEGDRIATTEEVAAFMQSRHNSTRQRAANYPDFRIFLDAQVKINSGDTEMVAQGQAQLEEYTQQCLAIKARFPK